MLRPGLLLCALLCLAAAVAGCGGTTSKAGATSKRTAATSTAAPTSLAGAIAAIRKADQFVFVQQTTAAGDTKTVTVTTGRYSVKEKALDIDSVLPGVNKQPVEYLQRSIGGNGYLQEPSWGKPVSSCWLKLSEADLTKQSGLTADELSGAPTGFGLLKHLSGLTSADPAKGSAKVPVATALSVFPGNIGAAAVRPGLTGEVPVSLALTKGIVEIVVSGPKVAAALKAAGEPAVSGLANADLHVSLKDDSGGPAIAAPATADQMTLADLKAGRCPTA